MTGEIAICDWAGGRKKLPCEQIAFSSVIYRLNIPRFKSVWVKTVISLQG